MSDAHWPLGVFSSIDAGFGVKLEVARDLGVPTIHLHAPHKTPRTQATADEFLKRLEELSLQATVVFAGFDGESYADIPTVKETVGLVPQALRAERVVELKQIIDFTKMLGVGVTGMHVGFVPHELESQAFAEIVTTTQDVCDHAGACGVNMHLETGQEPADVLIAFLDAVNRPNLFVNFDPANMILYGCGEPLPALRALGSRVRSVHCKDAKWSDQPGVTWGEEVPLGKGDVDIGAYLAALKEIGYEGPLTIERELSQEPERQKAEIGHAVDLLNSLKAST